MHKLDIWNQWHRKTEFVIKDGNPVIDGMVWLYVHGDDGLEESTINKMYHNHGEAQENGALEMQNDALINLLYFAAFRARAGVKVFGLFKEDLTVDLEELQGLSEEIDQLSTIFGYKTNQIDLAQFAKEFKDQQVYYSTLTGPNDADDETLFACSSSDDNTLFYPVFLLERHLHEFFEIFKRKDYPVMQADLKSFLQSLDPDTDSDAPLGVVIEPLYSCNVALPPRYRVE